jgi:hypothetical protein
MEKQIENLKAELKKIGILTEQDLNNAIRDLPPLKLYIMTGTIKGGRNGSERSCNIRS